MRALDVWYEIITLDKFLARLPNDEVRAQVLKRVRRVIDTLFPKLAEYDGIEPKIKDNPPLIFHPHKDLAPGLESEYAEVIAEYRASLPVHVRVLFDRFSVL